MISGISTHNQRIEDFGMTLMKVLAVFNMFFNIEEENSADPLNKKTLKKLQYIYSNEMNRRLQF